MNHLKNIITLSRINKPIGIFLLLWPTLTALWVAQQGIPALKILIIFILGTILMRSAGCIANDLADRNIDKFVNRTKSRPLANRIISVKLALIYFMVLLLMAFLLVLQLNCLTIMLSFLAVISAVIYPFSKRFFALPQLILGISFGFGILMAFSATLGMLPFEAWALFLANIFWTLSYDSHYAINDMQDDKKIKIHSSAVSFKNYTVTFIAFSFVCMYLIFLFIGYENHYSTHFYILLVISAVIAIKGIIRGLRMDPTENFKAFLSNNYVGFFMFIAFASQMSEI
ncbi:MAG TPA: 4-hydroxybenzoate octaprenyltransferase [Methylophilaceae bacterium]|jgi:4-hydroxybenzoate polyprenyltransferase|nr:4-hydroxybenzoate octaprenyltransferase [Methylophilaceae bacterium]|tara:strand:+ start:8612 stop:9466 length:855 start_codon:yes stop_codon:yes gene_type:complete